jgi:3-oxoacyl-[acyl-carrier protein] reductase
MSWPAARASGIVDAKRVEVATVGEEVSLLGRIAVVTGVSRRAGIGFAIAQRLLADGASVVVHSWSAHDAAQPWGADPGGVDGVLSDLGGVGARLRHFEAELGDPDAPQRLIDHAMAEFGAVDVLIANHARSSVGGLEDVTAEELDRSWAVNARAVVLLAQAYAAAHDDRRPHGRIILFTSGQHIDPMGGELAYAISKGAVHQMTRSLADELADRAITVNTINPGPVDTGWAPPEVLEQFSGAFPARRWGRPADIAAVVRLLVDEDSAWVTGQIINAEGGYRRSPL